MHNACHHRNILMGTSFQELLKQRTKLKEGQLMRKNVLLKDNYTLMGCVCPEQDLRIRAPKKSQYCQR